MGAARQLADRLSVTLLLTDPGELLPPSRHEFPILAGTVLAASGHLGAFAVEVQGLQPMAVSSRDRLRIEPLAGARQARGRSDPRPARRPAAVHRARPPRRLSACRAVATRSRSQRALFDATGLVGEFEKPRHVAFDADLCAHSRSRRTGCTRCLDQCPTGAITPGRRSCRDRPLGLRRLRLLRGRLPDRGRVLRQPVGRRAARAPAQRCSAPTSTPAARRRSCWCTRSATAAS